MIHLFSRPRKGSMQISEVEVPGSSTNASDAFGSTSSAGTGGVAMSDGKG